MSVPYYFMGIGVCASPSLKEHLLQGGDGHVDSGHRWDGRGLLLDIHWVVKNDLSILGQRDPNILRPKIDYHYAGSRKFLHSVINFVLLIGGRERPSRFGRSKRFDPYDGRPHLTPRTQVSGSALPNLLFSTFPLLQANHDQCSPPTIAMRFGNFITCCHPLGLDQCIYVYGEGVSVHGHLDATLA